MKFDNLKKDIKNSGVLSEIQEYNNWKSNPYDAEGNRTLPPSIAFSKKVMGNNKIYNKSHEMAYQGGLMDIDRYESKFEPVADEYSQRALNWDSDQRVEANQARNVNSQRMGLAQLRRNAAQGGMKGILDAGIVEANVMGHGMMQGQQATEWQKLQKLATSLSHVNRTASVTNQASAQWGGIQTALAQQKQAISDALSAQRSELLGEVAGGAAGYASKGGWWSSTPTTRATGSTGLSGDSSLLSTPKGNTNMLSYNNMKY